MLSGLFRSTKNWREEQISLHGKVAFEGTLLKEGSRRKNWNERKFMLYEDMTLLYHDGTQVKGILDLSRCILSYPDAFSMVLTIDNILGSGKTGNERIIEIHNTYDIFSRTTTTTTTAVAGTTPSGANEPRLFKVIFLEVKNLSSFIIALVKLLEKRKVGGDSDTYALPSSINEIQSNAKQFAISNNWIAPSAIAMSVMSTSSKSGRSLPTASNKGLGSDDNDNDSTLERIFWHLNENASNDDLKENDGGGGNGPTRPQVDYGWVLKIESIECDGIEDKKQTLLSLSILNDKHTDETLQRSAVGRDTSDISSNDPTPSIKRSTVSPRDTTDITSNAMSQILPVERHVEYFANKTSSMFYVGDTGSYDNYRQTTLFDSEFKNMFVYEQDVYNSNSDMSLQISMFDRSMYGYGSRNQVGTFTLPFMDIVPFTKQTYNTTTHEWEVGECSHIRPDGSIAPVVDRRDNVDISTNNKRAKISLVKYVCLTRKNKGEGEERKIAFDEGSDGSNQHQAAKSVIFAKIVIHAVRLGQTEYLPLYPFLIKQKNFARIVHLTKESMDEGFMTLEDWGSQANLDPFDTYFNCSSSEDDSDDSSDDSGDEDGYIDQLRQQHHMEMYKKKKERSEERDRKKKQNRPKSTLQKKTKSVKFLNEMFASGAEQHKSISFKKRGSRHINKVMSKQTNAHLLKLRREEVNLSSMAIDTDAADVVSKKEDGDSNKGREGDTPVPRRNNKKRVTLKIDPLVEILEDDGENARKGGGADDTISHVKDDHDGNVSTPLKTKESPACVTATVSNEESVSSAAISSSSALTSFYLRISNGLIFYMCVAILVLLLCVYHPVFSFVIRLIFLGGVNIAIFIEDLFTENDWIPVVYKFSTDYLHDYIMSVNLLVCTLYSYQNQRVCLNEISMDNMLTLLFEGQANVPLEVEVEVAVEVAVEGEASSSLFDLSWLYSDGTTSGGDSGKMEANLEVMVDDMPDLLFLLMAVFGPLLGLCGVYLLIKICLFCVRTLTTFLLYWSYIKPVEQSKEKDEDLHPDLLIRGNFLVLERQQSLVDDNYFRILCSLGYSDFDQYNQWSQLVNKHRAIKMDKRAAYVNSFKEKQTDDVLYEDNQDDKCPPISVLLDEVTSNENQIWRSRAFEITKQGRLRYQHRNRVSTLLSKQLKSKTIEEKSPDKVKDGRANVIGKGSKSNESKSSSSSSSSNTRTNTNSNSKGHTTSGRKWFGHRSFYTTQYALPDEMLEMDYSDNVALNGTDAASAEIPSASYEINEEEGYTIANLSRCTVQDIRIGCAYWIPSFYDVHLDTGEMNTSFSNFVEASPSYQAHIQREVDSVDDEVNKVVSSENSSKEYARNRAREQEIQKEFMSSALCKKMKRTWFHWFVSKKVKRYMEREKRKMRALGRSNVIMQRDRNNIDTDYYEKLWDEYRHSSGVAEIMDMHALAEDLDAADDLNSNDNRDVDVHHTDQGPSHDIRSIRYYESVLLHKDIKVPEEEIIKLPILKLKFPGSNFNLSNRSVNSKDMEVTSQEEVELLVCFTPGDIADSTRQTHKLFRQRRKGDNHNQCAEGGDTMNKNGDNDDNHSWLFTVFRTFVLTIITSVEIVLSWSSNTYPISEISKQELLRPQDQLNISIEAYRNYELFLLALQQSILAEQDPDQVVGDSVHKQQEEETFSEKNQQRKLSTLNEVKLLLYQVEGHLDTFKLKEKDETDKSAQFFHGLSFVSVQKATATIWTLLLLFTFFRYDSSMVVWIFSICTCLMINVIRWSNVSGGNQGTGRYIQQNTLSENKRDDHQSSYGTPVKTTDSDPSQNNSQSKNTGERVINAFQSRMRSIFPSQKPQ